MTHTKKFFIMTIIFTLLIPFAGFSQQDGFGRKEIGDYFSYYREFKKLGAAEQIAKAKALYADNLSLLQLCSLVNAVRAAERMDFIASLLEQGNWKIEDTEGFYHKMDGTLGTRDPALKAVDRSKAPASLESIRWNVSGGVLYLNTSGDRFSNKVKELTMRTDGKVLAFYQKDGAVQIFHDLKSDTLNDDIPYLYDISSGNWKRILNFEEYMMRSINPVHAADYIQVLLELAAADPVKNEKSMLLLTDILVQCGESGIGGLHRIYEDTDNRLLKADIGYALSVNYFSLEQGFDALFPDQPMSEFVYAFLTDSSLHADENAEFRSSYKNTDYTKRLMQSLSVYLKYNAGKKLKVCYAITGNPYLLLLHNAAYYHIAANRDPGRQKDLFALLDSPAVINLEGRKSYTHIRETAIRSLGAIGDAATLEKLKKWEAENRPFKDMKEVLQQAYSSLENNIRCGTNAYKSLIRNFDYDFFSSDVIYIFSCHPVNLFDGDSGSYWISEGKHRIKISFASSFMFDRIVFYKTADTSGLPKTQKVEKVVLGRDRTFSGGENGLQYSLEEDSEQVIVNFNQPHESLKFELTLRLEYDDLPARYHTMEFYFEGKKIEIDPAPFLEDNDLY